MLCLPFCQLQLARLKKYEEETLPWYLERLQELLVENNGGDGWFVGDDVSIGLHIEYCLAATGLKLILRFNQMEVVVSWVVETS